MKHSELIEFAATMARELPEVPPGQLVDTLAELCHLARRLNRWNEADCNVGLSPAQERSSAKASARAAELAKSIGCGLVENGDPRGYPLFLTVPSGKTTDWGSRGIGVPC